MNRQRWRKLGDQRLDHVKTLVHHVFDHLHFHPRSRNYQSELRYRA
jgi:hypothetical protein